MQIYWFPLPRESGQVTLPTHKCVLPTREAHPSFVFQFYWDFTTFVGGSLIESLVI